ncbi:ATP-dependent zinc metalloprotease FtsH 2 [Planctomycetes bacterium Poly30]|uniref:ATP-dependent zinc metalloprotease FtsH 2 n=1 Tax=Saltatorellus ferox TaxID=2528018 RepID=A0A518EVN1_9BACT|nr:ATP-dependent zinc metalloprotease FtsH 2 [Planctomycetes bacterium Poly30]
MTEADDPTTPLRDALRVSPDNVPLRRHLAETLAKLGRHAEAEGEFRQVLGALEPADPAGDVIRLALAATYLAQGKLSHADVLAELVTKRDSAPAAAFLLLARIRLAEKDPKAARIAFDRACKLDRSLRDSEVARQLGLRPSDPDEDDRDDDDLDEDGDDDDDEDGWDPMDDEPDFRHALRSSAPDPKDDKDRITDADFERPKIAFDDVGGMDDVKEEISIKVIQPLAHPELFAAYGKKVGGGVLMYGPPGCGKTHLARATAGEAKAAFMSVGIHQVLELWIGSSERNLRRIFDEARRRAPCVLFFDEVDALGGKRASAANNAGRQIINQFLSELDGVEDGNEGLLILAATNAPWHLDAAFRRPGRFDRMIFVPPPDLAARVSILEVLLRDKPKDSIDLGKIAKKTDRFSGADLKGLVDLCIEGKLREALKTGKPGPITEKDLLAAAKRLSATTSEWFATAKNHVLFANEGGSYDDVAAYMGLRPRRDQS